MLGPSLRSNSIFSYKKLKKGYSNLFVSNIEKKNYLMCYFGNSKGPQVNITSNPNLYNKEADILGFFKGKITHPNVKRGIAAKLISEISINSDCRIINDGNYDLQGKPSNQHLFIPLRDYKHHISKFKYNLNISGHRLSIPFRFIYSFIVGTAIITDKLKVKWYRPFNKEVVETVEMGYLPIEKVDWIKFKENVSNLPDVSFKEVQSEFNSKWSPIAFTSYVIKSCQNIKQ